MAPFIKQYAPHAFVALLAFLGVLNPALTAGLLQNVAGWFLRQFDWLTLMVATGSILFCAGLALSPVGRRRIGGEGARPDFSVVTWLSMLFAAGMGAGLVFWGAAEPLIHYLTPPPGTVGAETNEARVQSLAITQFHWSLHAWSIYAVAALAVAMHIKKDKAPLPSIVFQPLAPTVLSLINWSALFAVIFGVVASLGQGVFQMGAGLSRITDGGLSNNAPVQMVLLALLTVAYLVSASTGIHRGIAILSNINMVLSVLLAAFILSFGPTKDIILVFWESLIAYGQQFISLSVDLRPEGLARSWTRDWSLTYFLWWVAWTPFVGVFIARISYGRTIRGFVAGVVLVPSFV
ncbi:MAG: BCCT family transporter, partial [Pseudomonadota bacterium]